MERLPLGLVDDEEQPATLKQVPARPHQVRARRDAVTVEVVGERLVGRERRDDRIIGCEPVPKDSRHRRRGTQRAGLGRAQDPA